MKLEESVLIADARSTHKGAALWLEILKGILFLVFTSIVADTSFVIVVEEMLAIQDEIIISILYLYWQIIVIILCALFAHFIQHRTLGFRTGKAVPAYLRGMLIGSGMITAVALLGLMVGAFSFHGLSEWLNIPLILLFFGGYIFQGAAEEVLCRGYILLSIARKHSVRAAIIFSSLIFAFMHSSNTGFGVLPVINLFLFAVFESVYYLKTENIWGVSAIHTAWNFVQGCIYGFGVSGESLMPSLFRLSCNEVTVMSGGEFGPEGGIIVTAITVVSIVLLLRKNT